MRKLKRKCWEKVLWSAILVLVCSNFFFHKTCNQAAESMETIPADEMDVQKLGRTLYNTNQGILYCNYTASGIAFYFRGRQLDVKFVTDPKNKNDQKKRAWVGVFLDGNQKPDRRFSLGQEEQSIPVFRSKQKKTVRIEIRKLSEAKDGKLGIQELRMDHEAKMMATEPRKRKIEFIGDSITCGYGIEGQESDPFDTSQENGMLTYAAQTANMLQADFSVVAVSGIGVYSSVTKDGTRNTKILMPKIYPYTDVLLQKSQGLYIYKKWDFTEWAPDVIVINLGVNDATYVKQSVVRREQFGKAYAKFLEIVRKKNRTAKIFCAIRADKQFLFEEIQRQVAQTKDKNMIALMLPNTIKEDGYGANRHPNEKTHLRMAQALTQMIKEQMKW